MPASRILIRHRLSDNILHAIETEGRNVPLYPVDLHGLDLSNLELNGAELSWANLERCNLRGTKLREANLFRANLRNAIIDYADLRNADLRESNLEGAIMWPSDTLGAKFFGAAITPNSEVAEHARLAIVDARRSFR